MTNGKKHVVIIGAGISGLAAGKANCSCYCSCSVCLNDHLSVDISPIPPGLFHSCFPFFSPEEGTGMAAPWRCVSVRLEQARCMKKVPKHSNLSLFSYSVHILHWYSFCSSPLHLPVTFGHDHTTIIDPNPSLFTMVMMLFVCAKKMVC
jgi:hypothetical protein